MNDTNVFLAIHSRGFPRRTGLGNTALVIISIKYSNEDVLNKINVFKQNYIMTIKYSNEDVSLE